MCSDFLFVMLGLESLATPFHQAQADDLVSLCLHPSDIYVYTQRDSLIDYFCLKRTKVLFLRNKIKFVDKQLDPHKKKNKKKGFV